MEGVQQIDGDAVADQPCPAFDKCTHDDAVSVTAAVMPREFGFASSNAPQLFYHFILAALIGITLRLTTFQDATLAASVASHTLETSFLISFGFTKALSNLAVGWTSDRFGRTTSQVSSCAWR